MQPKQGNAKQHTPWHAVISDVRAADFEPQCSEITGLRVIGTGSDHPGKHAIACEAHVPPAVWRWRRQVRRPFPNGIEAAEELAEELAGYLPEETIGEVRESVQERLQSRIDAGDADAVSQFATFHLQMLEEPDYETAYVWFSISAALGLEGALEARDDARDNVDDEKIVDLQSEAGTIYESLNISLD